ncbi:hypothetical protein [Chryseobacterium sp. SIMBA_038]|uniref:hypothetical protein n=2 Tax=Pseudomonadati TaxID=3379134 RepID=UPI0039788159
MKKIALFILGLAFGSSLFAQNSTGNLHIVNYHSYGLDLYYTLNTVDINNCDSYKSNAPAAHIAQGNEVVCVKYSDMMTNTPHFPYPNTIDGWTNVTNNSIYTPVNEYDVQVMDTVWDRIDFELNDSSNYSATSPLTGSVGFVSSCISNNASVVTGSGTLNGNNYDFKGEAFTMGGDYWVFVK